VIMKKPLNVEFSQYVDQFMSKAYQIIHNQVPPRIFPKCKKLLLLTLDKRVGDYYIFEHYTKIRVYGCQLSPFHLPIFMTPRIFALEYVRQRLNSDEIHFVPNKYEVTFKLKKEVGPFIVNTRSTLQVTANMLSTLGLQQGEPWNSDPRGIISSKIISHGQSPYQHQQKEQLELLANQDSCQDVQNILQIQCKASDQSAKSPITQTPHQFEKTYKSKHSELALKNSETGEEGSALRNNAKEIELPEEIMPKKKGIVVTVEVISSEKLKSVADSSKTESGTSDQSKQLDQVQRFMEIRKAAASIKKSIIPKVYEHDAYQTIMISDVDYEKGVEIL
jgi:hypothetical protein